MSMFTAELLSDWRDLTDPSIEPAPTVHLVPHGEQPEKFIHWQSKLDDVSPARLLSTNVSFSAVGEKVCVRLDGLTDVKAADALLAFLRQRCSRWVKAGSKTEERRIPPGFIEYEETDGRGYGIVRAEHISAVRSTSSGTGSVLDIDSGKFLSGKFLITATTVEEIRLRMDTIMRPQFGSVDIPVNLGEDPKAAAMAALQRVFPGTRICDMTEMVKDILRKGGLKPGEEQPEREMTPFETFLRDTFPGMNFDGLFNRGTLNAIWHDAQKTTKQPHDCDVEHARFATYAKKCLPSLGEDDGDEIALMPKELEDLWKAARGV